MRYRSNASRGSASFALTALCVAALGGADGPGFPNVPQTPGTLLSDLVGTTGGRMAIIAYHKGYIVTIPEAPGSRPESDLKMRTWDISDPRNPREHRVWGQESGVNAHGYSSSGQFLMIGGGRSLVERSVVGQAPNADFFTIADTQAHTGMFVGNIRSDLTPPWCPTMFWSYGPSNDPTELRRGLGGPLLASWNHLADTGVIGHPIILGNLLIYAGDQSGTGVATYDISDPSRPRLLGLLKTDPSGLGIGGYWPEIWGGNGKLLLFFPRTNGFEGFTIVDITDPTDIRWVMNQPLAESALQYAQFQDHYAFSDRFKIDMRTGAAQAIVPAATWWIDTSQYSMPLGNLLLTGGIYFQGMAIWAHAADPDTTPPSVGYHIPRAGQTSYPLMAPITLLVHETLLHDTVTSAAVTVRPVSSGGALGAAIATKLSFTFDDLLNILPSSDLAPDTTYEVRLIGGGIKDAVGNGIAEYSFRFSTGPSVVGEDVNRPPSIASVSPAPSRIDPGAATTVTVAASDPDAGQALHYQYAWGDGAITTWSANASASHAYAVAGHYRVTVTVRDPSAATATASAAVTVAAVPSGPSPTNSSPVAVDAARRRVWTVNPDADTISAVDADGRTKVLEVAVAADPRSLAIADDGSVWVACHDADRIEVFAAGGARLATIDTGYGSAPAAICRSRDGSRMYVSCMGDGRLLRLDTATRVVSAALALGPTPNAIAITGDGGRILVTRFISAENRGEVYDVAAGTFTLTRVIPLAKSRVPDSQFDGRGVPNHLAGIAIDPRGARAWVVGKKDNTDAGVLSGGGDLGADGTVRTVVAQLVLASSTEDIAVRRDLDNGDSPRAVAFSPLGDYAFIAMQGNDRVLAFDALEFNRTAGLGSLVSSMACGAAPQGLAFDPATQRLFSHDLMGRSLSVLELEPLIARGGAPPSAISVITTTTETASAEAVRGKRLFYHASDRRMSAEGYMACATCHADGGADGRVYDFSGRGEGLRRTVPLWGRGGTAHGRVHWSANFDEIQDFEHDIRGAFGGTGFLSDAQFAATSDPLGAPKRGMSADLDAIAAYLTSLDQRTIPRSPHRADDGAATAEAVVGRTVFDAQDCASCHRPADGFRDGALHDVGTISTGSGGSRGAALAGIDTPTLLGLHVNASFLHDGSAATLADVFAVAGGAEYQAEAGTPTSGASLQPTTAGINPSWRGGRYVRFAAADQARIELGGIDGGAGGGAQLRLRVSADTATAVEVLVNGVSAGRIAIAPSGDSAGSAAHVAFSWSAPLAVVLAAGASNRIALVQRGATLAVDLIRVAHAGQLAKAQPHRRVLALPAGDRDALLAYLRQLDARDTVAEPVTTTVSAGPSRVVPGAEVTVAWSRSAATSPRDWLGLYQVGGDGALLWWAYTGGATSGSLAVSAPAGEGTYEFRYLLDDGYVIAATSASFAVAAVQPPEPPQPPAPGTGTGIARQWWSGLAGSAVADLIASGAFPAGPSGADIRPLFEAPVDWADGYGTRMRGHVTAPVAGAYVFTIAGDDECQLWLSPSGDPAQKTLIAAVPGWTSPREWDRYPEQRSVEIHLAAGQRCYIEALHKEGWGGDSLAVAWRFPNGAVEAPIPGHRLTPYDDAPLVGDGTGLAAEYYDGPDFTTHVASRVDAVVDFAWSGGSPHAAVAPDTFSARWRGQVQAMTTGTYAFHVVGDDGVRLTVGGQTVVDAWRDQSPTESTGSIALVAGRRYDLVLEYYENGGGAECHLLWSGPGVARSVVPSSQLYPSPLVPVPQPPQPPTPDPDPQPVNLVRNPGFELGLADWRDQGASTTVAGSGIGGGSALRIGTGPGGRVQDLVGVVGGASYALSALGRVSHNKERGSVVVEVVGGDGLTTTHALPFNSKGWTRRTLTFTAPPDVRAVRVRVLKAGNGWFFYADDLSVTAAQALPSGNG